MSGEKGDPNRKGNARRWIVREVEDSLRRLQTDWIDLYQVHRWDYGTAHEETLSALTDLRTQGKIRAFGCSTYPAHETVEARWTAERLGLGHYATEQPPYSILFRGIEADILPVAGKYEMGVIPWSPLAGGWLTGRSREGEQTPRQKMMSARFDMSLPSNQRKAEVVDQLEKVAEEAGLSMIHMALGFVLAHPAVTAPIIGPRTMDHLESQLGAAEVTLSKDVLDKIDEIAAPGTDVAGGERSFTPPAVAEASLRRRPSGLA